MFPFPLKTSFLWLELKQERRVGDALLEQSRQALARADLGGAYQRGGDRAV